MITVMFVWIAILYGVLFHGSLSIFWIGTFCKSYVYIMVRKR